MFVYVISASPEIHKIGISKNPDRRMAGLQQQTPFFLSLAFAMEHPDAREVEQAAHRALSGYKMRGEWFSVSGDAAIAAVKKAAIEGKVPTQDMRVRIMTPDNLRAARATLGQMWDLGRPLQKSEMGRALRLKGRDPGAMIGDYERGTVKINGPLSVVVDMMLSGALPPDGLDSLKP